MHHQQPMLSVMDISEICTVARSTVSYWITQKGLSAHRSGNKFVVPVDDLIIFLESTGRPIPEGLVKKLGGVFSYPFKSFQNCWEFWGSEPHGENCKNCMVFKNQIQECFTLKNTETGCKGKCSLCRYFYEYYTQYTSFIHQMSMPVAVFKDMYIWAGNRAWADLCGIDIDSLTGIGVEEIIHPESIREVINFSKKIKQGENNGFFKSRIIFENGNKKKFTVNLAVSQLKQPEGVCFAIVDNNLS